MAAESAQIPAGRAKGETYVIGTNVSVIPRWEKAKAPTKL